MKFHIRNCGRLVAALFASCIVILPLSAADNPKNPELEQAVENLRSSDAEWRREDKAYRAKRRSGKMAKLEAEEYAEFVAGLHRQKLEDCEALRRIGGNEVLKGFDCVLTGEHQKATIVVPPSPTTVKTEGEKIDALEARLKRLESELDEELLRKQQAYRRSDRPSNSGGGLSGSDSGAKSGDGSQDGGKSGSGSGAGGKGKDGQPSQGTGNPSGSNGAIGNRAGDEKNLPPGSAGKRRTGSYDPGVGPGLPKDQNTAENNAGDGESGNADDIVMRQIREAAERETDPVMKEKLWKEYNKLKAAKN
jgi:hypothetical protein